MAAPAEPVPAAPVPVPVAAQPVPVPAQPVPAQPLVKVKRAPKRINIASVKPTEPHAILQADTPSVPVENAYEIEVKKIEVDGRPLYYNYEKEKLYDLKFKYIGRLKDGKVASFPDSDADL